MLKSKTFILFLFFTVCFLLVFAIILSLAGDLFGAFRQTATYSSAPVTVIIDAGHGGEDGGTVGVNGVLEKDLNLNVAKKLAAALKSMGVRCVLTRSDDRLLYDKNADFEGQKKRLDMKERLRIVGLYENAIFISIHQNSFPIEKYSGFQIYYSTNHQSSLKLGESIAANIRSHLQPSNNRACKPSSGNIYLLERLSCPALLLECGFLSNENECDLLCDTEYQTELCTVIAASIENFIRELP